MSSFKNRTKDNQPLPISGRVDRASVAETRVQIPAGSNQRLEKLVFTATLLDVQQLKEQYEASKAPWVVVDRWQLDWKIERSLRCLLAKATW